jgi:hypothetical protein
MKTIVEINASKIPLVIIDKKLNRLNEKILFPQKVTNAIKTINNIGLPKIK